MNVAIKYELSKLAYEMGYRINCGQLYTPSGNPTKPDAERFEFKVDGKRRSLRKYHMLAYQMYGDLCESRNLLFGTKDGDNTNIDITNLSVKYKLTGRAFRVSNKEWYDNYKKRYYEENCEEIKNRVNNYRLNNREKISERKKRHRLDNPEHYKRKAEEKRRKHLHNMETDPLYKEEYLRSKSEYRDLNRDRINASKMKSHYKIKEEGGDKWAIYAFGKYMRCRLWKMNPQLGVNTESFNGNFEDLVGCSKEFFNLHISSQFVGDMSWENYGKAGVDFDYQGGWQYDHIIPIDAFKNMILTNRSKAVKVINHYTNLQPMWATENNRKNAKFKMCDYNDYVKNFDEEGNYIGDYN